ncbi:putative Endoplasmic reticulum-Golgi intermediate compartment protein 3 [Blattamonas nauphoetae]|uniref:Endoplasmic reticulum-Golgi intermediate compartment protein 3 n=1 Tax=Blattamonas nauphoetae TaxID=2049346 RepID=A0ABQ9Y154_9EUKA|nr:putative Endoplasmic reticulum-Golgi intermediate compartment protein 3 [Blattamonas nauphoetae]
MSFRNTIQKLDQFQKQENEGERRVQTNAGAIISLVTLLLCFILTAIMFFVWLRPSSHNTLVVDTNNEKDLLINFDIVFPDVECRFIAVGFYDKTQVKMPNTRRNIHKHPLSATNPYSSSDILPLSASLSKHLVQAEAAKQKVIRERISRGNCFPCFEAETEQDRCCNTCLELIESYQKTEMDFIKVLAYPQCQGVDIGTVFVQKGQGGCNVHGQVNVNRVGGLFEIGLIRPFRINATGKEGLDQFLKTNLNFTHTIRRFSFGKEHYKQKSPLEGKTFYQQYPCMFQYQTSIVPTTYISPDGSSFDTHQYSVSKSIRPYDPKESRTPGLLFFYDFSPQRIVILTSMNVSRQHSRKPSKDDLLRKTPPPPCPSLINAISSILHQVIKENCNTFVKRKKTAPKIQKQYLVFYEEGSNEHSPIEELSANQISSFLSSLLNSLTLPATCLLPLLIYLDRLIVASSLILSKATFPGIAFTALILTQKMWDDWSYENKEYQKLKVMKGLTLKQINKMERTFLSAIQFNLDIDAKEFEKYRHHLIHLFGEGASVEHALPYSPGSSLVNSEFSSPLTSLASSLRNSLRNSLKGSPMLKAQVRTRSPLGLCQEGAENENRSRHCSPMTSPNNKPLQMDEETVPLIKPQPKRARKAKRGPVVFSSSYVSESEDCSAFPVSPLHNRSCKTKQRTEEDEKASIDRKIDQRKREVRRWKRKEAKRKRDEQAAKEKDQSLASAPIGRQPTPNCGQPLETNLDQIVDELSIQRVDDQKAAHLSKSADARVSHAEIGPESATSHDKGQRKEKTQKTPFQFSWMKIFERPTPPHSTIPDSERDQPDG